MHVFYSKLEQEVAMLLFVVYVTCTAFIQHIFYIMLHTENLAYRLRAGVFMVTFVHIPFDTPGKCKASACPQTLNGMLLRV